MPHFPKPAAGSWTENWPELGTAPINYNDSIDPEHYRLEQQAKVRLTKDEATEKLRAWLGAPPAPAPPKK